MELLTIPKVYQRKCKPMTLILMSSYLRKVITDDTFFFSTTPKVEYWSTGVLEYI